MGEDLNALLEKLTLDEKILLLSAKNVWETPEIDRVGIPSLKVRTYIRSGMYNAECLSGRQLPMCSHETSPRVVSGVIVAF
jgi:hypothetical protein